MIRFHSLKALKGSVVVTDTNVAPLLACRIEAPAIVIEAGEAAKTRQTKEWIEDQMLQMGIGRDGRLIALGGGVVTDLAAFVAATYCRGIALTLIPTTLLAMVDASIGGKCGVNTPFGKNLIGAFYTPQQIILDISLLHSLPELEMRCGAAEMIKHALIQDPAYAAFLQENSQAILAKDPELLQKAIAESIRIKQMFTAADPQDRGRRHMLNFGHTIAHAIEHLSHYTIAHGEAVAIGMAEECRIAVEKRILREDECQRVISLIESYSLPTKLPFPITEEALCRDKKALAGKPRYALIKEIGVPYEELVLCD